jgi:outer membrane protein TolC
VVDDEAVRAAYDLTKMIVAAETASAFADACNAGEELQVTRRSLELQVQSTDTTRRLVEAGNAERLWEISLGLIA